MATGDVGKGASGKTAKARGRALEGQTVVGRAFYVWDEDRRHALEWGAELGYAAQRGAQRRHRTQPAHGAHRVATTSELVTGEPDA